MKLFKVENCLFRSHVSYQKHSFKKYRFVKVTKAIARSASNYFRIQDFFFKLSGNASHFNQLLLTSFTFNFATPKKSTLARRPDI